MLKPFSPAWRAASFTAFGVTAGAALFVFHVSRAASYLSDRPDTCINCHVMNTAYLSWQHSSHAQIASCNDCHVPHDSLLKHYLFKVRDGLWHATVFTMRWEPQVIRLSAHAVPVVEANCRRCHADLLVDTAVARHQAGDLRCWDCHRETPHGSVRSLSTLPDVFRPRLPSFLVPRQRPTVGGRPL